MRPRNIRFTFLTTVFVTLLLALATLALLTSTGVISNRGLLTSIVPGDLPYPYAPQGIPIPGLVQAEDYQTGGEGVAYHDTKKGNTGGQYRTDDVDIERTTDTGGGYNVGWIETGEWLTYKVDVLETGAYSLMLRVARAPSGASALRLEVDGQALTGTVSLPSTGGWQTWTNLALTRVTLQKGVRTLKLVAETGGFNINWLRFAALASPTPAPTPKPTDTKTPGIASPTTTAEPKSTDIKTPAATPTPIIITLPATIEAELYKNGGEGIAYHDTTKGNTGGQYRSDDVDIEKTTDEGGGYNVGWIEEGEWLRYTINVPTAGTYFAGLRVAMASSGPSALRLEVDGKNVTSTITVPSTGGWQKWTTVMKSGIALTKGTHELRFFAEAAGFNLNWIKFGFQSSL